MQQVEALGAVPCIQRGDELDCQLHQGSVFRVVLPRGVVRSILDRADGVPLYIEACTRSVLATAANT